MGLFKKGNIWYVGLRKMGVNIVKSTRTKNKKLAQEIFDKILSDVTRGLWFKEGAARNHTFKDMWERYKERHEKQRDKYSIKHLMPFFGDKRLHEIDASLIEDYIVGRLEAEGNPSEGTICKEYALARRMFNIARKTWKWVQTNPFSDFDYREFLNPNNPRDRWLTVAEETRLLAAASTLKCEWIIDLIIFAIHTGCRRGEILTVKWDNIDLLRNNITVQVSKRKKKDNPKLKSIPISKTLKRMLIRRHKVQHISGLLFPVDANSVRWYFDEAVRKSGLENVRLHDLRRTFGTRLAQAGIDLFKIKNYLGHESILTTERHYAVHCPHGLGNGVEALDACYEAEEALGKAGIG